MQQAEVTCRREGTYCSGNLAGGLQRPDATHDDWILDSWEDATAAPTADLCQTSFRVLPLCEDLCEIGFGVPPKAPGTEKDLEVK